MVKFREMGDWFDITEEDKNVIRKLGIHLIHKKKDFVSSVIHHIFTKYGMPKNIQETVEKDYQKYLEAWFVSLMGGKVSTDIVSFMMDFNIKQAPSGYYSDDRIAVIFSYIRNWFREKLYDVAETEWEFHNASSSFGKMIDLSMYIVNHDYLLYKSGKKTDVRMKDYVIKYSEKFSTVTHTVLIMLLMCMTIGGVSYFLYELTHMAFTIPADKLFITALGSLLVVWVLVELLNSEVQMLKGDRFKISIFVGVALIAFIRDLLIMTLKHDTASTSNFILIGGVLILGFIYWLVSKNEAK